MLCRRRHDHRAASKAFFLEALEPLGVAVVSEGSPTYGVELSSKTKASLCLYQTEEKPARLHLAFTAENRQQVEAFYIQQLLQRLLPPRLPHPHPRHLRPQNPRPRHRRQILRTNMRASSAPLASPSYSRTDYQRRPGGCLTVQARRPRLRSDRHRNRRQDDNEENSHHDHVRDPPFSP